MEELIKQRLKEELTACPLTRAEIAKRVGVSPEMITQYITTKNFRAWTRLRGCAASSTCPRSIFSVFGTDGLPRKTKKRREIALRSLFPMETETGCPPLQTDTVSFP